LRWLFPIAPLQLRARAGYSSTEDWSTPLPASSSPLPSAGIFDTALAGDLRVTDGERPHDFNAALAEYSRLLDAYPSLGYDVMVLPKVGVVERANIVLTAFTQETS
jgi:hypothetical protein